jgi:hypothetical protein
MYIVCTIFRREIPPIVSALREFRRINETRGLDEAAI